MGKEQGHSITKVLIANRGEIALRVIKTCRDMGLATVAVYSDADRDAPFVRGADEAVYLGGSPALESYLNQDAVIRAAQSARADAIHPGYGFLSENATFAARCEKEGITFIGPTAESISMMGSKIGAKELLQRAAPEIPLIPGYQGSAQDVNTLMREAERVGYPILVKASAGGGGKGMRVVREPGSLRAAIEGAKREAKSAFGDESLLIERYFEDVRHIEVQIIGDKYGNVVHCFERECSVQRRHQKVIEETPSVAISEAQRDQIGRYAVAIGKTLRYLGLGTVEFIFDNVSSSFFFLEVNTRLQVEHPVTEAVTGLDLVRVQISVAMGRSLESLSLKHPASGDAAHVTRRGHAVEARLCAEDAARNFVPCAGPIAAWLPAPSSSLFAFHPASGIRYDAGYATGTTVSIYYDNLLAKVIAFGETREEAVRKLDAALAATVVLGITTNLPILRAILSHPQFVAGRVNTHFIQTHQAQLLRDVSDATQDRDLAVVAMLWGWSVREAARTLWRHVPSGFRTSSRFLSDKFTVNGKKYDVEYQAVHNYTTTDRVHTPHQFTVRVGDSNLVATLFSRTQRADGLHELDVGLDGVRQHYLVSSPSYNPSPSTPTNPSYESEDRYHGPAEIHVFNARAGNRVVVSVPRFPTQEEDEDAGGSLVERSKSGGLVYRAPMPGKVVRVCVREGEAVKPGDALVVLEAMKMENTITAQVGGVVSRVPVKEGELVNVKGLLVEVAAAKE